MSLKQTVIALVLLAVGIGIFGLWASRTEPIAQAPQEVAASEVVDEGQYYSIRITYPAATPDVRATIESEVSALAAEFKANAKVDDLTPEDIEVMGLGDGRKYTFEAEHKEYTSPEYRSYVYTVYEDTLGAHPNTTFKTFVFDKDGNRKTLTEVLSNNPNALEELSLLVSNDVVAQYRQRAQVDDVTGLLYDEGLAATAENYSNFYVDGDDLVVLFPPYQVAAYAAGSFESRVPLADINR
jgi:hypothetical protein